MTFEVLIEETIVQAFKIEAESEEEAAKLAEDMYRTGNLVLEEPSVTQRCMSTDGNTWREF